MLYPLDQARDMLRFYRDFCATLPDEAEAYAAVLTAPQGMPVAAFILGYNGPIADGEKVLAPARKFGTPIADLVGPMPYAARQRLLDEPNATHGLHRYWRSAFTEKISDELVDALVEAASRFQLSAERVYLLFSCTAPRRASRPPRPPSPQDARSGTSTPLVSGRTEQSRRSTFSGYGPFGTRSSHSCRAARTSITCRKTTSRKRFEHRMEAITPDCVKSNELTTRTICFG